MADVNPLHRVIVPLDGMDKQQAMVTVSELASQGIWWFKVGKSLINQGVGGEIHRVIAEIGGRTFWDNKDRDIRNTIRDSAVGAREQGVEMFNVFADIGVERMQAAVEAKGNVMLAAVTVLTDVDDEECQRVYGSTVAEKVVQFASWAEKAKVEALICSPTDLAALQRARVSMEMLKVTPGVRPLWAVPGDQKRVATPFWAILNGAGMLVIGRPITKPPVDFVEGIRLIANEIQTALDARELRRRLCELYYETGSVQFGEFTLSAHRDDPTLEKSPIYLHYPADGHPLLSELYDVAAELIREYLLYCCATDFDRIAGVPRGALPLAISYAKRTADPSRLLLFKKEQPADGRTIFTGPVGHYEQGENLLWIEDHTSGGRNKLLVKRATEERGMVVTDMLTIVDRQQGGVEQMAANGVTLHSLLTLDDLLLHGLRAGYINKEQDATVRDYIERNQLWSPS